MDVCKLMLSRFVLSFKKDQQKQDTFGLSIVGIRNILVFCILGGSSVIFRRSSEDIQTGVEELHTLTGAMACEICTLTRALTPYKHEDRLLAYIFKRALVR